MNLDIFINKLLIHRLQLFFLWTVEHLITVYEVEWLQWKKSTQPQKSLPDNA